MSDARLDFVRDLAPDPCAHCGVAPGEEDDYPAILTGEEDRDWVRLCDACAARALGGDEEDPDPVDPEEDWDEDREPCDRCGRPLVDGACPPWGRRYVVCDTCLEALLGEPEEEPEPTLPRSRPGPGPGPGDASWN
jgi:hypothetical protein